MAQAVSRRPVTTEARVRSQVSPLRVVVDNVALGQVLLPALRFPSHCHFSNSAHSSLSVAFTRRTDGRTLEVFHKAMLALSET
jgi:hypothetical protein